MDDLLREFRTKFDLDGWNEEEEDRLEGIAIAKLRGKGAPKKKRTAEGMYLSAMWIVEWVLTICRKQEKQEEGETVATLIGSWERVVQFTIPEMIITFAGAGLVQIIRSIYRRRARHTNLVHID